MRLVLILTLSLFLFPAVYSQSMLSAKANAIVDATGKEVQLRGVNLGVWFLIEPYMISEGQRNAQSQWRMKRKMIDKGATAEQVEEFFTAWRNTFIQRSDIDHIALVGLNSLRMPLHYELFLTTQQRRVRNTIISDSTRYGAYIDSLVKWQKAGQLFTDKNTEGYQRIDSLLSWCRPHNMYITLDLHAAPGGQGAQTSTSDGIGGSVFWKGKYAARLQSLTNTFWQHISERYKDEPLIAMYDIINEPNHIFYPPRIRKFYTGVLRTIRSNNDKHLVMLEGCLFGSTYMLMRPEGFRRKGFDNIVYNTHDYSGWTMPKNKREANLLKSRQGFVPFILTDEVVASRYRYKHKVPIYINEFGEMNPNWVSTKIHGYDSLKFSWCMWSYKQIAYEQVKCPSGLTCTGTMDIYTEAGRQKALEALRKRELIINEDMIKAVK